jgi:hypothetical protein
VNEIERARISMMARSSKAPSTGRIQKRKTNFSKSSLSACNARPVHTDGPEADTFKNKKAALRRPFQFLLAIESLGGGWCRHVTFLPARRI